MIDNYLLEELVTFKETKTLAATAEKLNLTQPSVTRGMQKLESVLGVQLFDRQPNRITLTEIGEVAAKEAKKALKANQDLVNTVQNFARSKEVFRIGMTIPGPMLALEQVKLTTKIEIEQNLQSNDAVERLLKDHMFTAIFSNQELMTKDIESRCVGIERLIVNLDQFMYHANQETITFKELKGLSFIVLRAIGPWSQMIQESIPDATFMYQEEQNALAKLTKYSNFPYFTTNLSKLSSFWVKRLDYDDRVSIPISDESAQMPIYVSYLKQDRKKVLPLIKAVTDEWPN
ncbi:LysR family transcriptional regulator [Xylocopilactobacillus apis]|uniref:LysR family transcriptional regulator n=1 Tax=Xylocopilactobacillus apis TaxID=2932183 RepID=A0AAU9CZ44_9LACO|nr:LysR family transcriptional regulator [Xylocopilactobacillus apis]BDR55496.1 LysR family transcriptional regulator [Xylocopilactobacillus apis]